MTFSELKKSGISFDIPEKRSNIGVNGYKKSEIEQVYTKRMVFKFLK